MTKRRREDSVTLHPSLSNDASSQNASHTNNLDAPISKFKQLSSPDPALTRAPPVICHLPPHPPLEFPSTTQYERHYIDAHSNRCITCLANLPSPHLLALHITEQHDPIASARRGRGEKIYACFVEGCEKRCLEWKKRRSHLVDKHGYPRNYDFLVVDTGVDGRRSLLRAGVDEKGHRRSSREKIGGAEDVQDAGKPFADELEPIDTFETDDGQGEVNSDSAASYRVQEEPEMDEVTQSLAALRMVPRSVTFGKPRKGAGLAKS